MTSTSVNVKIEMIIREILGTAYTQKNPCNMIVVTVFLSILNDLSEFVICVSITAAITQKKKSIYFKLNEI